MRIQCSEYEEFPGQAELWAANLDRSLRGRKGQAALRELETALLELSEKRLIADHLQDASGGVCALAALAKHKGVDIPEQVEPEDEYDEDSIHGQMISFGKSLKVPRLVAMEIVYRNDDDWLHSATPEDRYKRILSWTQRQIARDAGTQ